MNNTVKNIMLVAMGSFAFMECLKNLFKLSIHSINATFKPATGVFHIESGYAIALILVAVLVQAVISGLIGAYCFLLSKKGNLNFQDKRWLWMFFFAFVFLILEYIGWHIPPAGGHEFYTDYYIYLSQIMSSDFYYEYIAEIPRYLEVNRLFIIINIGFLFIYRANKDTLYNYYQYSYLIMSTSAFVYLSYLIYFWETWRYYWGYF